MPQDHKKKPTLEQLLKYCLGYVKLINPALSRYKIYTEPIDPAILDPQFIFNLDPNEEHKLPLQLKEFYELTPKELTKETEGVYRAQKELGIKLEEIKNKHKINEYTKQINLNFGYFTVEVPETESFVTEESEDLEERGEPKGKFRQLAITPKTPRGTRQIKSLTGQIADYPLFLIPVEIGVTSGKYHLEILDHNVTANIGFLQDVLGEYAYFEFSDFVSQLEVNEQLTLPIKKDTFSVIWEELKSKLRLSEAQFDENSFDLNKIVVSLSSKTHFFLTQDLKILSEMPNEELLETSLGGWVSDEDLTTEEEIDENSGELFFPFDYDKHQLKVLSIINNKAAIVQGPPGTGKSQTIANLLCHLAAHGKRVLFLSQKAQALKVVKDKLKTLGIDYLYGYIPNRFSPIYTPEEEIDGASNTLAGIKEYISFIHDRSLGDSDTTIPKLSNWIDQFNESVEQQRTFHYLYNQLLDLEEYKVEPLSESKFLEGFTKETYNELKSLQNESENLGKFCGNYIKETKNLKRLENKFGLLPLETANYSEALEQPIREVEKKGYDRGNRLVNVVRDRILLLQLRSYTSQLPREVYETFKGVVLKNLSRTQTVKELRDLQKFFYYEECTHRIRELREKIEIGIIELGLDGGSLTRVERLMEKYDFEKAVVNCKKYIQLKQQIKNLKLENLNAINKSLHEVKETRKGKIRNFVQNRLKKQILNATYSATIRGVVARIARALQKTKRAYRTFDQLKKDPNNFQTIKELVPVWIMDLEDASRLIPLERNMFDYIILDESSQCNLAYAIPAMYRSQHVIFFGDSEQMRDDSVRFKTNRSLLELAHKYNIPEHLQIKSRDDAVKSVLDIGGLISFWSVPLLYHYRSPKELIGFSNESFYIPKRKQLEVINTNYLPYKDTDKILVNHVIKPTRHLDISEKSNIAEAKFIANLVKELQSDEKTKDKSIGVLTFFNEQAYLLGQYIEDESVKVSIIEGIQGDERDIIIYSFVISSPEEKKRYVPLTGEYGEINKELNAGRVNVAFSRARLQVHCVTSMPVDEWPDGVWIKRYLDYVEGNGRIDFYSQQLKDFDSAFEEELYHFLRSRLGKGFIIQNQVESCSFKIDFVITEVKSGKKLAVECDGPTHFEDEVSDVYITSDFERQSILEKAGWKFYRIAYFDWVDDEFDKDKIVKDIKNYFTTPSVFLKSIKSVKVDQLSPAQKEYLSVEKEFPEREIIVGRKNQRVKPTFAEITRVSIDDRRDLVVSSLDGDIWINMFLKSGPFVGFSNKGVGISIADIDAFVNNSLKTLENGEPTSVNWRGGGKSKIVVQKVDDRFSRNKLIDVRQYVEAANFTGFTRRGFRLPEANFKEFLATLKGSKNSLRAVGKN